MIIKSVRLKTIAILLIFIVIGITSCTDNQRARSFGGTEKVKLLPNEEFINITWKKDNLWVVVTDKNTGNFYAREKSSFGVMQGNIVIEYLEQKQEEYINNKIDR